MEAVDMLEALKVLDSSLSRINWRLRASSRRRLETDANDRKVLPLNLNQIGYSSHFRIYLFEGVYDLFHLGEGDKSFKIAKKKVLLACDMCSNNLRFNICLADILALCFQMRPVIMIDYGGKMPELRERLCAFLKLAQEESSIFENLRVMVIEDMIYLIHVRGLADLIKLTINKELELHFVDLEQDPPKMITEIESFSIGAQFVTLLKLFSSVFCADDDDNVSGCMRDSTSNAQSSNRRLPVSHQPSDFIDLSHFMQDTLVTVPTLNGWLLGYPVVYIFGKDHIEDAVYNLSTKSLHLFNIFVRRNSSSDKRPQEELMSFSVPYDLSVDGEEEPWAEAFLVRLKAKWEGCKHVWGSMKMEVSATYPQAIAL
ncbi:hypothetical protein OSB04_013312 [Centaurea solstitialis]|uniref:Uncharacterized protein n=1 Tax=Centaurea solstitialis TaxID=347529 RepID=A0AA38TXR3_9ASTR|nr:hypothetical protein OSB04_013312 [Centaurea solstitialis]